MIREDNIDTIYKKAIFELLDKGTFVKNTIELLNFSFTLTNINNNVIKNLKRDISIPYIIGELSWYNLGLRSVKYISNFGNMWEKLSDDGVTNNSAYGYLLQKKYNFNQIDKAIELLKTDPNTRRCVLNLNFANENVIETKDEPCTICLNLYIRNNKLHCTGIMRSNDVWFGLPYDIIFFTELQKYIARELDIGYGEYTHFATSFHVYEDKIEKIKEILKCDDYIKINLNLKSLFHPYVLRNIYEYVNEFFTTKEEFTNYCKEMKIVKEEKDED